MGTFDNDDIDDALLGSLFGDWDSVLSEGLGDVREAGGSVERGLRAGDDVGAVTARAVDASLSELCAVSQSAASPSPASPPTPGSITVPALDASLSELGATSRLNRPTLPRTPNPVVRDMTLSRLDAEWFADEDESESTRFGDMSEHVARMALIADAAPPVPSPDPDATRFDASSSLQLARAVADPSDDSIAHFDDAFAAFEATDQSDRETAEQTVVVEDPGPNSDYRGAWSEPAAEARDAHDRPTAPEPSLVAPRLGTDEEFQRFIDGYADADGASANRSRSELPIGLGSAPVAHDGSRSSRSRLSQSTPVGDGDVVGGRSGLSSVVALGSSSGLSASVLGDASVFDGSATRLGDSASLAAADRQRASQAAEQSGLPGVDEAIFSASTWGRPTDVNAAPSDGSIGPSRTPTPTPITSDNALSTDELSVFADSAVGPVSSASDAAGVASAESSIPESSIPESEIPESETSEQAGAVEAQSTPAPVRSSGPTIVLDHSSGPSEVERRVTEAVEQSGECLLTLGPRSVIIDRAPGPRGQWRAVEPAHDRAFAAGSVRSLIRRITAPRRGGDSVLEALERRLARS